MTIQDLLDQAASDADDSDAAFEIKARRWLNFARSYMASKARWRDASRVDTFNTSSGTSTGLYTLVGYEHLVHDVMWDETNDQPIQHESYSTLNMADNSKSVTGPPSWWGDAGVDDNDQRRIYLWPIPDGTYTIRFQGFRVLDDLTEDDDPKSSDPFFGKINDWAAVMSAGIRYYHDLNNNEDPGQIALSLTTFDKMVMDKRRVDTVAPTSTMPMKNVRQQIRPSFGRFNPAHYSNR